MATFVCSLTAAACFTGGGLLTKPAAGLSRMVPTLAMFGLFVVGAGLLAMAVKHDGEVGPAYLVVVGLETVLAFALGVALYGEQLDGAADRGGRAGDGRHGDAGIGRGLSLPDCTGLRR